MVKGKLLGRLLFRTALVAIIDISAQSLGSREPVQAFEKPFHLAGRADRCIRRRRRRRRRIQNRIAAIAIKVRAAISAVAS